MTSVELDVPGATERVLALLPAHLRARDLETGGALHALLGAVAGELALLERDIGELYDGWFVETCAEWLVPYLADLVGIAELPPDLGAGTTRRAFVANTVAYRRRKGTVAVLEQLARDVTGWPARAVEQHPLLVASAHSNHVRLDRPATVDLRSADRLDLVASALDPFTHTAEARRISSRRGRYGIPRVAVLLFPLQVYEVRDATARAVGTGFTLDPLGRAVPLLAVPRTESAIEHLAQEPDLPVPLRPRRLLGLLQAARAGTLAPQQLPLAVTVGGPDEDPLPPERLRVCGLEDLAALPGTQVMVDPVSGSLTVYAEGAVVAPERVGVTWAYGGLADVGAGPYDRSDLADSVLATDGYAGDPDVLGQVAVRSDGSGTGTVPTVAAGTAAAETAWAAPGPGSPAGGTWVVAVGDSASYDGDVEVSVPEATRLVLTAALLPERRTRTGDVLPPALGATVPVGLRPHLRGTLRARLAAGASLVVDGLLVEGDVDVEVTGSTTVAVAQSTVTGAVRTAPAGQAASLHLRVLRTVAGSVQVTGPATVAVTDAVLDPGADDQPAVDAPAAHVAVETSTLLGTVSARTLDASSAVLAAPAVAAHRQAGCVRFSYVAPGSRVGRRYRCVPASETASGPAPVLRSRDSGSPYYPALAASCDVQLTEGAEGETEMGVHAHLDRPRRVRALERQLGGYLPAGLETGVFEG